MPVAVCPECGYDTKGLPSNICPECGKRLPEVAPPGAPRLRWRILVAAFTVGSTIGVGYVATGLPGVPRWWGTLPLTVLYPYFLLGGGFLLAFVPLTLASSLLSLPVALGRLRVPWWTTVPVLGVLGLAWYYFAIGMRYGLEYQGTAYVAVCGSVQVITTGCLAGLWLVNRRRRRFALVVAWHLLAALWLASYAFPYYGELP